MSKLTSPDTSGPNDRPLAPLTPHEQIPPSTSMYIYLELVDANTNNSSWADPDELQIIKAGRSYELRISISDQNLSLPHLTQKPCRIRNSADIYLLWEPKFLPLTIEDQKYRVSREEVLSSLQSSETLRTWNVTLPEDIPTCPGKFQVLYHPEPQYTLIAACLEVTIKGAYDPDEKETLKASNIKLDAALPEQAAVLHIAQADTNKLTIKGWSKGAGKLNINPMSWEPIKLAEFIERGVPPGDVIEKVRGFSRTAGVDLMRWLKKLLMEHGKQLSLVIFDHTDLETPWEMLETGDQEYLGAQALVVRWMDIRNYGNWYPLQMQDVQKQGSVIAYLDYEGLGEQPTKLERQALKGLKVEQCPDLQGLKEVLAKEQQEVGLIYLGCHGSDGTSIGRQREISQRITLLNLEIPVSYPEPRPIVFVNACESARLKREGGDYFRGLLEVFLARFAAGYIGTIGPVGSTYASAAAQELLQAASKGPVQIAEVLRQLKEEAIEALNEALKRNEPVEIVMRKKNFLFAFTYVYYGNALVRLILEGDGAGGAEA